MHSSGHQHHEEVDGRVATAAPVSAVSATTDTAGLPVRPAAGRQATHPPDRLLALQRAAGNAATSHAVAGGRVVQRADGANAPPAARLERVDDTLHHALSDRILAASNTYQHLFDRQLRAVEDLAADLARADAAPIAQVLVDAGVEDSLRTGPPPTLPGSPRKDSFAAACLHSTAYVPHDG